ncbi:hypothetical protein ACKWTF_007944 [Chironomus riparius]
MIMFSFSLAESYILSFNSDFEVTSQKINKMSKLLQNMPLPSTPSIHQNETAFSNPMPPSNNSIGMLPGNYEVGPRYSSLFKTIVCQRNQMHIEDLHRIKLLIQFIKIDFLQ